MFCVGISGFDAGELSVFSIPKSCLFFTSERRLRELATQLSPRQSGSVLLSTLMICSSVDLLLRMSVSLKERTLTKKLGHLRGAGQRPSLFRPLEEPYSSIDHCIDGHGTRCCLEDQKPQP